jgi:outer membrane protein
MTNAVFLSVWLLAAPAQPPSPARLTLSDALMMALREHATRRRAQLAQRQAELDVRAAHAAFDSSLDLSLDATRERLPFPEQESGEILGSALTGTVAYRQTFLPGTQVGLELSHRSAAYPSVLEYLSPRHGTELSLHLKQPFLRGGGFKAGAAPIQAAEARARAARHESERTLEVVAARVAIAYWRLALAQHEEDIQRRSLEAARQLLQLTRQLVRSGSQPAAAVSQPEATAALREAQVLAAERAVEEAALRLAEAMLLEKPPPATLIAQLPEEPGTLAAEGTLEDRSDVQAAKEEATASDQDMIVAADRASPVLNVEAVAGLRGLGGIPNPAACGYITSTGYTPAGCAAEGPFAGDVGRDVQTLTSGAYYFVGLGLEVELPIRNAAASASAEQARLRAREAREQLKERERTARAQVQILRRSAALERQRLKAAKRAHAATTALLESEEKRFRLGASTAFDVLRIQQEVADAQRLEAKARTEAAETDLLLALAYGRALKHLFPAGPPQGERVP